MNESERNSESWRKVVAYLENRLSTYRERLESASCEEKETIEIRAKISFIKDMLGNY